MLVQLINYVNNYPLEIWPRLVRVVGLNSRRFCYTSDNNPVSVEASRAVVTCNHIKANRLQLQLSTHTIKVQLYACEKLCDLLKSGHLTNFCDVYLCAFARVPRRWLRHIQGAGL